MPLDLLWCPIVFKDFQSILVGILVVGEWTCGGGDCVLLGFRKSGWASLSPGKLAPPWGHYLNPWFLPTPPLFGQKGGSGTTLPPPCEGGDRANPKELLENPQISQTFLSDVFLSSYCLFAVCC